jgi:hypothetical protein
MTRVNSRSELAGSKQFAQRHEQVQVEIGQVSGGTRHGATI